MRRRHNPPVSACLQDYTMHAPDASCDNRGPPKKSHPYLAFTSLMHGAYIQPWTFRPTCRTHRKRQPRVSRPPPTCPQALIRPDHLRKKREISLLQLLKTKRKMDQALERLQFEHTSTFAPWSPNTALDSRKCMMPQRCTA